MFIPTRRMAALPDCVPTTTCAVVLTLEKGDVDGAVIEEPLDTRTIPQLRWWLLCHGIESPSSDKKATLIERY